MHEPSRLAPMTLGDRLPGLVDKIRSEDGTRNRRAAGSKRTEGGPLGSGALGHILLETNQVFA
jgi:hypothetical protein